MRTDLLALLAFAACSGSDTDTDHTDGHTDEADTDTDTDSDTDTDTDSDTDTTPTHSGTSREGVLTGEGTAQVTGTTAYAGSETLVILGDSGYGDPVCTVTYDLVSTGTRADCPSCEWAFDLAIANAAVTLDVNGGCQALGVDASTIGGWNGQTKAYGFVPEYFGHPDVVVVDDPEYDWRAMAYASWDEGTGSLSYLWTGGVYPF